MRHVKRAIALFGIAMMVTLITFFVDRGNTILFGILHLISFGIFFGVLLTKRPYLSVLFGLVSFYLGAAITCLRLDIPSLLPFGITYPGFQSFDYFPLFPWIGFIFFGIAFAHFLDWMGVLFPKKWIPLKNLEWLGRHALFVYLIHQPILFGILWLFA